MSISWRIRNNGNWGVILNEDSESYKLAPIFDNGNSFYNKFSDKKIEIKMLNKDYNDILGTGSGYIYKNKILSSKKLLELDIIEKDKAIKKVYPVIEKKLDDILNFMDNIPEKHNDLVVLSKTRKEYYKLAINERLNKLLKPAYERA